MLTHTRDIVKCLMAAGDTEQARSYLTGTFTRAFKKSKTYSCPNGPRTSRTDDGDR